MNSTFPRPSALRIPGAVLIGTKQPQDTQAFLNYLSGPDAAKCFQKYGFNVINTQK
ncbi:MAG: substrate-binding domain-containing protein [Sporomusaceae bacterium]|nr:substrate-binding domain-containing protein [Sporomusaceae bacterium]